MRVTIHQPNFCPYPGFFQKILLADVFVIMDDVQIEYDITNRNKIITQEGNWERIIVPIKKHQKFHSIMNVEIDNDRDWKNIIWNQLLTYDNEKYFNSYKNFFNEIFHKNWDSLFELNFLIIKKIIEWLNLKVEIILESELKVKTNSSQRLVDVCKAVDATTYLSGTGAKNYLDKKLFLKNNINLEFQKYSPIQYPQVFSENFIPNLSILDSLFNVGEKTMKLINPADNS